MTLADPRVKLVLGSVASVAVLSYLWGWWTAAKIVLGIVGILALGFAILVLIALWNDRREGGADQPGDVAGEQLVEGFRLRSLWGDRRTQVVTGSAVAGAAVFGTGGVSVGLVVGSTLGIVAGTVPALFTFGLSIPVLAVVGGAAGAAVGGAAGAATGGAVGYGASARREDLDGCAQQAQTQLANLKAKTVEIVSDSTVQTTAVSAAGGAVVLGAGGAATGLFTGGAVGAAVGVVPAIFTFGLSIPICAAIGGGVGLASGAAVGSTAGAVVGGAGGYGYSKREAIGSSADAAATFVKEKASTSTAYVRSRLAGTTGGTE